MIVFSLLAFVFYRVSQVSDRYEGVYTQWFEYLGAQPMVMLIGGLIAIGIALMLRAANRSLAEKPRPAGI
jgi:hypothetical protein